MDNNNGSPDKTMLIMWFSMMALLLLGLALKALPKAILALAVAAPSLSGSAVFFLIGLGGFILALRNNQPKFLLLPIYPIVMLFEGARDLFWRLRHPRIRNYYIPDQSRRVPHIRRGRK